MNSLLLLILGYLLGSVPFAYLVARAWRVDIFAVGTRNPGAANVFRAVSRRAGVLVLLGDAAKSALPVVVAKWADVSPWVALAAGVAAMVGHWYPLFLRFRGGAGLATAIGVGYGMMPLPALAGTVPGLVVLYFLRSTGPAAGVGFLVFFLAAILLDQEVSVAVAVALLPPLALARERLLPTVGKGQP
ncbi:MAG: glycerol-3-phosphate acyltransferase [Chloroflexi bacterium]|nr:glycerol-3-phosphate acyltransferase [Chloroflexota bacterium]